LSEIEKLNESETLQKKSILGNGDSEAKPEDLFGDVAPTKKSKFSLFSLHRHKKKI
tara:strand:+ start:249 stop:416 length:168 start_codon:yes stop_codon:yes gene_type:complete